MRDFIDTHRTTHGVEPICKVLQIAPSGYRRHAARRRDPQRRCARAQRDDVLMPQIEQVGQANMKVYGADKVWRQLAPADQCCSAAEYFCKTDLNAWQFNLRRRRSTLQSYRARRQEPWSLRPNIVDGQRAYRCDRIAGQ